jgi:DNA-binding MarR family transcriptional regulator
MGLVRRKPDQSDGRSYVVELSAAGDVLIDDARNRASAFLACWLDSLNSRDLRVVEETCVLLERLFEDDR